jgi:hypothetical protein
VLGNASCASCHTLPLGSSGEVIESLEGSTSPTTNIPQLRGLFERISPAWQIGGEFGMRCELGAGLGHAGAFPGVREVILQDQLGNPGVQKFAVTPAEADSMAEFLSAFDNGLAPSTGFQATANSANAQSVEANELSFLLDQARLGLRRHLPPDGIPYRHSDLRVRLVRSRAGPIRAGGDRAAAVQPHALMSGFRAHR